MMRLGCDVLVDTVSNKLGTSPNLMSNKKNWLIVDSLLTCIVEGVLHSGHLPQPVWRLKLVCSNNSQHLHINTCAFCCSLWLITTTEQWFNLMKAFTFNALNTYCLVGLFLCQTGSDVFSVSGLFGFNRRRTGFEQWWPQRPKRERRKPVTVHSWPLE